MTRKKSKDQMKESSAATPGHGDQQDLDPPKDCPTYHPVRYSFTSRVAGVRAGEDKSFSRSRVFVDFDPDRPASPEENEELKAAGFRVLPADVGYTAVANVKTRQARDDLAQKFTYHRLKPASDDPRIER